MESVFLTLARSGHRLRRALAAAALASALLAGCVAVERTQEIAGRAVDWSELPGWTEDQPLEAWPALLASCQRLGKRPARAASGSAADRHWQALCEDMQLFADPPADIARAFFETRFQPYELQDADKNRDGLVTGYYEPLLNGSLSRDRRFRYPVYGRPEDLLVVDLGELYPELAGRRVRGRLVGHRVVPYPSRAEISGNGPLRAPVLAWVDDAVALFFLEIQGSGRIRLGSGEVLHLGYVDQNGHPYHAIGRTLIERGALTPETVSLQTIRAWLAAHPDEAEEVLHSNPSYVFFAPRDPKLPGPLGSLNVPLLAGRSVAVDPKHVPLGYPLWLDTSLPLTPDGERGAGGTGVPYRRLVFAHDTGGAIKGPVRADVFFGFGAPAEELAGRLKSPGRLYLLRPRPRLVNGSD